MQMILKDRYVIARIEELERKVSALQDDAAWDGYGTGWKFFGLVPYVRGPRVSAVVRLLVKHLGLRLSHVPAKGSDWELLQEKTPPNKRMKLTPRKASRKSK